MAHVHELVKLNLECYDFFPSKTRESFSRELRETLSKPVNLEVEALNNFPFYPTQKKKK